MDGLKIGVAMLPRPGGREKQQQLALIQKKSIFRNVARLSRREEPRNTSARPVPRGGGNVARLSRRKEPPRQTSPCPPRSRRNVARLGRREELFPPTGGIATGELSQCGSPWKARRTREIKPEPGDIIIVAMWLALEGEKNFRAASDLPGSPPSQCGSPWKARRTHVLLGVRVLLDHVAMWLALEGEKNRADQDREHAEPDVAMWLALEGEKNREVVDRVAAHVQVAMWLALEGEKNGSVRKRALSCGNLVWCEGWAFDPSEETTIYESRSEKVAVRCLRARGGGGGTTLVLARLDDHRRGCRQFLMMA
jgi:hypothetical protein